MLTACLSRRWNRRLRAVTIAGTVGCMLTLAVLDHSHHFYPG